MMKKYNIHDIEFHSNNSQTTLYSIRLTPLNKLDEII